jgi:hypothetical protein
MPEPGSRPTFKKIYTLVLPGLLVMMLLFWGLFELDQHLHRKFDRVSTLNRAGYRGHLLGPKAPNEKRIFLMGGSTALGYGVEANQTVAACLEQLLNANTAGGDHYSVVNLGFNSAGAAALVSDLRYYSYLEPDAVIFYTGYDDLMVNTFGGRQDSVIFRLTGYYPIVPLVISEKAKLLRYQSWGRWSQSKPVFRPGEKVQAIPKDLPAQTVEHWDWSHYCAEMQNAIKFALRDNDKVLVVTEPYFSAQHIDQQRTLREMIEKEFGNEQRVRYVDLGPVLNPNDQMFTLDGFHLNATGNRIIAEKLLPIIQESVRQK